jgi:iron complex outermembrane receptor protein
MGLHNFANALVLSSILLLPTGLINAAPLEEVTVTAQKREQSLMDVPISITAVTSKMLTANLVDDIFDLRAVVPALDITAVDPPGVGTAFSIRGLGNSVFNMGFEPSVGAFVDGVYRSRSGLLTASDFSDLERVEVLKGPQGTLFGRNTSAGVVHFISKRPSTEAVEGMARVSYEEHNRARIKGAVNVPFSDTLAGRLSANVGIGDGWMDNVGNGASEINDLDRWSVKGQLAWEPSEDVDVWLSFDYSELDEKCCLPVKSTNDPGDAIFNQPLAAAIGSNDTIPANINDTVVGTNITPRYKAEDVGVALEVNWDIGDITLTSLTAYRDFSDSNFKDNDFTGVDILLSNQNLPEVSLISEEFRLSGDFDTGAGSVHWTAGMFYSKEEIQLTNEFIWSSQVNNLFFLGPFISPGRTYLAEFQQEVESIAGFGHFTWDVNDKLSITGGFRYSDDQKDGTLVDTVPQTGGFFPGAPNSLPLPVVFSYDTSVSFSEPTGTASINYAWTEDVSTFFTYSHGYKSGGISMTRDAAGTSFALGDPVAGCAAPLVAIPASPFCVGLAASSPTFESELSDHYEIGLKSKFFENRLQVLASAWVTDFDNLQIQVLRPDGTFAVTNAASAKSQGMEIETVYSPNDYVDLNFSLQWLDATYGGDVGFIPGAGDLSNQNLDNSSEITGVIGGTLEVPMGASTWNFFMSGNLFFRSETTLNPGGPNAFRTQGSYELLNMRGGVRSQDDKYEVAIWCRNCTNEIYQTSNFAIPFDGVILGHGARWSHIGEPRFVGITGTYRF